MICDQEKGHVVHVADGRSASAVEEYLGDFDEENRAAVKTVPMDMWQAYINAVDEHIPGSEEKICFDKRSLETRRTTRQQRWYFHPESSIIERVRDPNGQFQIDLDFDRPGEPIENRFMKSFNGHFCDERLDRH